MKSLKRNERITLRQVTRIYHWFRSVQLHFIISKLIWSVHVIYQKCVIFILQIWIFDEMRDSHNVSKIGLIFSALSKSACGGLVRQVRHFVQPCLYPRNFTRESSSVRVEHDGVSFLRVYQNLWLIQTEVWTWDHYQNKTVLVRLLIVIHNLTHLFAHHTLHD